MKLNRIVVCLAMAGFCSVAAASTYKCAKGGQTVYSDVPCAAGASSVDQQSDKVGRDQKRQAENVHRDNRRQLSTLEYEAAVNRHAPRGAVKLSR